MKYETPDEGQVEWYRREGHYSELFANFRALKPDEEIVIDPEPGLRIQTTAFRVRNALNQRAMVAGLPYTTSVRERPEDRKLIVKKWFGKSKS